MSKALVRAALLAFALGAHQSDPAHAQALEPIRIEVADTDVDLHADGRYVKTVETRVRIQTAAAAQADSQAPFTFNASMQRFDVVQAYTLKADGRRIDVKKDAIFTRDLPMSVGAPLFADIKQVIVIFPDVAAGDSIHAAVRVEQIEPTFPGHYSTVFSMTPHLLVDQARIRLHAPRTLPLQIDNEGYAETRTESGDIVTHEWTAQQRTVEPVEPGSISALDYSRRLSVSTFATYTEFAQAYAGRAVQKAAVTDPVRTLADEITASVPGNDAREQAKRLYEWVTVSIRYVGIFLADGAVVPHAAEQVLANRYGDCKDQVTLLTSLLAAKGIEAQPAILSAGTSFWVSKIPLLPNFNHVVAYVPAFGVFLDATSGLPFGRLPRAIQGKTAVLVPSGELKRTPSETSAENVTVRRVTYVIKDNGTIDATTAIEAQGARAEAYRALARNLTSQDMPEFMRLMTTTDRYKGEGTIEVSGANGSGAVKVTARYTLRGAVDWPGNGSFSTPAGFAGFEHLSSQISHVDASRRRPVYAGSPDTLVEEYEIGLPPQMDVIGIPEGVSFRNELGSYEAAYRRDGQTLFCQPQARGLLPRSGCAHERVQSARSQIGRHRARSPRTDPLWLNRAPGGYA